MDEATRACPICGAPVPGGAGACPRCGTALAPDGSVAVAAGGGDAPPDDEKLLNEQLVRTNPRGGRGSRRPKPSGPSPALQAQMDKLELWQQKAASLRVMVPTLPKWVQGAEMTPADEERWEQGVQGLVRAAYKEISGALETWQKEAASRLNRLEAYGMPSPTERRLLEETARSLKAADLDHALELYEKVSTVVGMKERNLNEALDAVEALKLLSTDLDSIKISPPWNDPTVATRLEGDIRSGKVAEALQEASKLRKDAATLLTSTLPSRVNEAADQIASEKAGGADVKQDAALLARAAHALRQGRAEDALRDLVRYQGRRTLDPFAMVEQELKGGL